MNHQGKILRALVFIGVASLFYFFLFFDPVVLKVGSQVITKKDIEQRDQIVHIFYPQDQTKDVGLIQLKKAFIFAEILKMNGLMMNETNLVAEKNRIETTTKDPLKLQKIKAVFNKNFGIFDEKAYLKVFVFPTLVERILNPSYFEHLPIHEETHQKAIKIHDEISIHPEAFSLKIKKENLQSGFLSISRQTGVHFEWKGQKKILPTPSEEPQPEIKGLPQQLKKQMQEEEKRSLDRWFRDIVDSTRVGELVKPVVSFDGKWMILKLRSKTRSEAKLDAIVIEQINFEIWFEKEKAKVKIE